MPIWDSTQHSLFPKDTANTHSTAWVTPADCKNGMVEEFGHQSTQG